MAVSFGSTNFAVKGDQNWFPLPARDQDGALRYRATIRLASQADSDALAAAVSLVTPKRALGTLSFSVEIEAGPSPATLTIPVKAGATAAYSAVLTSYAPKADGRMATRFEADAEWLILGDAA
jgi:hypothetical protein